MDGGQGTIGRAIDYKIHLSSFPVETRAPQSSPAARNTHALPFCHYEMTCLYQRMHERIHEGVHEGVHERVHAKVLGHDHVNGSDVCVE